MQITLDYAWCAWRVHLDDLTASNWAGKLQPLFEELGLKNIHCHRNCLMVAEKHDQKKIVLTFNVSYFLKCVQKTASNCDKNIYIHNLFVRLLTRADYVFSWPSNKQPVYPYISNFIFSAVWYIETNFQKALIFCSVYSSLCHTCSLFFV